MAASSNLVAEAMLEDKIADMWPDYPCLYDVRCPEFKNRDMRDKSMHEMAGKLGQTAEWVKTKIKALRNSFVKAKKPTASGSARKNPTRRTIWLLDKLQFLAPHVATRASISNIDSESCGTPTSEINVNDVDYDGTDIEDDPLSDSTNPANPTEEDEGLGPAKSTSEPLKRHTTSRKRQADEEYNLIKGLSQSIANKHTKKRQEKQTSNMLEAFGHYVTKALSEMDSQTSNLAQHKINNIIFEAQAGSLRLQMQPQIMVQPQPPMNHFHPIMPTGMSSSHTPPPVYPENS